MIDIHSHILFGVDDGPENIEGSLMMLKDAVKSGYTDIVCTSHYYPGVYVNKNYDENFKLLEDRIKKEKMSIRIYKGNEIIGNCEIFSHLERINTINHTRYILIELDPGTQFKSCKKVMEKFIELGYKPVLAHIERYIDFSLNEFRMLYNMGVIFQVNIREIVHIDSKIKYMIDNMYVKIIASDSHRVDKRNYNLNSFIGGWRKNISYENFKALTFINPQKIIKGEVITSCYWKKVGHLYSIFEKIKDKMLKLRD